jgi:hypothetical protein
VYLWGTLPASSWEPSQEPPHVPQSAAAPPVSAEHAAIRDRIERGQAALLEQIPDGTDLDEAVMGNPDLAAPAAECLVLMREERDFLAGQGVDPRPWRR